MEENKTQIIFDILNSNGAVVSSVNIDFFRKMTIDELKNSDEVMKIIDKIKEYEEYRENATNRYPEYIMEYLRQRNDLDEYDISEDAELNKLEPCRVFSEVCKWNGLTGGYAEEIKGWIKDIYKVDLDEIDGK